MALKFLAKTEEPPKLPEGGDRFIWDKLPESVKKIDIDFAAILKGKKPT